METTRGSQGSDGYQDVQMTQTRNEGEETGDVSGNVEYYEEEHEEFLSFPFPPTTTSTATAHGVNSDPIEQKQVQDVAPSTLELPVDGVQYVAPDASQITIDGNSADVSAIEVSSDVSSVPPQSPEEYSGIPEVDEDIEVGKKIIRRRKLSAASPPSSSYADVKAPGMELMRRALQRHKTTLPSFQKKQPRYRATEFHDENGHMFLYGSSNGKYVGDVVGGLPHGRGQHWTPSPSSKEATSCRSHHHLLYEGSWQYGAKVGSGRMFYHNNQEYRGYFKESRRHGRGTIHYLDGTVYDGEWYKGRRHGIGTSYYKDGGFYSGAWCKDNRDGWGVHYWPNKCRKYEGEWVGDDPVCGNYTKIEDSEYLTLQEVLPEWCNIKEYFPASLRKETLELPMMQLRYPESAYYPHACARRQHRIDIKRAALKNPPDPSVIVEHKGSLTPKQMQALKLAFDKLSPGYYRLSMLNKIHIRRMILLAQLDPDSEMGKKLFIRLQDAAIPTMGLTYNNLIKTILQFKYPQQSIGYKSGNNFIKG